MRHVSRLALLLALSAACLAQQANSLAPNSSSATLVITSSAFIAGGEIPEQDSCKGADKSPELSWSGAPMHTVSFALILEDPDAPHGTWVHWVVWNIPANEHELPAGEPKTAELPDGADQGRNDFHQTGYNGPCPPGGQTHRYYFRLYALNAKLELGPNANKAALTNALKGHVLAQAEYMGTFHK